MKTPLSRSLFAQAQALIPGGVNSPVRSFGAVGGQPLFLHRGHGARVWDVDGNEFIDFVGSWGPLILGHAHTDVVAAVRAAAGKGTSFGAPTPREVELARLIHEAVPSMELVRLVNSGTEAAMSAIRAARAYTRRSKVIKFAGCYHGHADGLLVEAGSGAITHGVPSSAGVPPSYAQETLVAEYNDLATVERLFQAYQQEIAAVIVEPVAGNMGVVPPAAGFLAGLRDLAHAYGALLIFDEVITGFRVAYGGAQALYGVTPDITCLGKVIGGGLPVGAYGGCREVMEVVSPLGPMYQAGTLSGNPLAVGAGVATLRELRKEGRYELLERLASSLAHGLVEAAQEHDVPLTVHRVGSMLTPFFSAGPVVTYADARQADTGAYATFFHAMLERGVYLPPSQFEAWFLSLAHTEADIAQTVQAARFALAAVRAASVAG
ncbi:MAG: glutamate-1-semialdehyde 2,1-aminomutase [Chloroflexi bacterium]|nr:glutamate-1-semialdehyde 2,1-aminomutase [Chloroflexota bacterium]